MTTAIALIGFPALALGLVIFAACLFVATLALVRRQVTETRDLDVEDVTGPDVPDFMRRPALTRDDES